MQPTTTAGFRTFFIVWLGQLVSIVGSGLTDFALGLYVYQETKSVTQFALILFCRALPVIVLSPFAGAWVDRWDKRRVMLACDLIAAAGSFVLALLCFSGQLHLWQIYLAAMISAGVSAFQVPAYLTATTALIPVQHLGRVGGMVQIAQASAEISAPLLAGLLLSAIGVQGVLLFDVASFVVSILTLWVVRFPSIHAPSADGQPVKLPLRREIQDGIAYIIRRSGLVALLAFFAIVSFESGMIASLVQPLILAFAPPQVLGLILSVAGGGLMLGGLLLSIWGGPRRRIQGVLIFVWLSGIGLILIGLRPSPILTGIGAFAVHFCFPFINGCNQAIWQSQVTLALQGRVFAIRQMVVRAAQLLAFVLAGPLTDNLFTPLLADNGPLANTVGQVIGVGAGRGMALIFILMGGFSMLTALFGWLDPHLRLIEAESPA